MGQKIFLVFLSLAGLILTQIYSFPHILNGIGTGCLGGWAIIVTASITRDW